MLRQEAEFRSMGGSAEAYISGDPVAALRAEGSVFPELCAAVSILRGAKVLIESISCLQFIVGGAARFC